MSRIQLGKLLYIVILIIFDGFLALSIKFSLSDYLSKNEKVNANLLIVEGWIPDYAVEMANKEFVNNNYDLIITTGLKLPEYFPMGMNGYLIFYPKISYLVNSADDHHVIEVDAFSELEGENCAYLNLFVNDSLIGGFFADKSKKKYIITWDKPLAEIDSIMVQFTNDGLGDYGDRNLFIKEIIIDYDTNIPYQLNSEYDMYELDGKDRSTNNNYSYAEIVRNKLLALGVDSSRIIAAPLRKHTINRTLNGALEFRDWLNDSGFKVSGINIIGIGSHTRRTWMVYNKVLDKTYNIGILSLPDFRNNNSRKYRFLRSIRETLGIIYYWIILLPY
jgi:hypothetical protein